MKSRLNLRRDTHGMSIENDDGLDLLQLLYSFDKTADSVPLRTIVMRS